MLKPINVEESTINSTEYYKYTSIIFTIIIILYSSVELILLSKINLDTLNIQSPNKKAQGCQGNKLYTVINWLTSTNIDVTINQNYLKIKQAKLTNINSS